MYDTTLIVQPRCAPVITIPHALLLSMQAYCNNVVDHHMILDLAPSLAAAFFRGALPATQTPGQAAVRAT
jgi:Possible tRNA binding domain